MLIGSWKEKKHIKVVKVKDGKKVELDTVIENDKSFVWMGDTISGGKALMWVSEDDLKLDSLHQHFDMDFDLDMDSIRVEVNRALEGIDWEELGAELAQVKIHLDSVLMDLDLDVDVDVDK